VTRWAFNASEYIAALGGDPTYAGMELDGESAMPVLQVEAEHVTRPLFASLIGRVTDGPYAGPSQFSVVEFIAPNFGIWLERLANEGASILSVGFSQDPAFTPATVCNSVLVGPDGVQDQYTGDELIPGGSFALVQRGRGSGGVAPVVTAETFQIAVGEIAGTPLWLPAGRHCYVFGPAVNTAITASWVVRLPAALV